MALSARIKYCYYSSWITITHIQHYSFSTTKDNQSSKYRQKESSLSEYAPSFVVPNKPKGAHYIHKLKSRLQFTLKQIEELQYKQQQGMHLDRNQLHKIERKQEIQDKLAQIRNGTFQLNQPEYQRYQRHQKPIKYDKKTMHDKIRILCL